MASNLTEGSLKRAMLRFSIPFLIASFLQSFYGLTDLFIAGQFNGPATISAVSSGSQMMHMLTVVIIGLATGTTVTVSRAVGAGDRKRAGRSIGNSVVIFLIFALVLTVVLLACRDRIVKLIFTPPEAVTETGEYLSVCFGGILFITAYNVIAGIYRGLGDTKSPMYFVAAAGIVNILGDYVLMGPLQMGARGAAIATVGSQALSVLLALLWLKVHDPGIRVTAEDLRPDPKVTGELLQIGLPIAVQEGLIQISFVAITAIGNSRGVTISAAIGIVEKFISFAFLVHSAMLSTVSAIAAQNAGSGQHGRARQTLQYGLTVCLIYGGLVWLICQFASEGIVSLFVKDQPQVTVLGGQYLRSYAFDCIFAGVHFCFSGFFSAYRRSVYSFLHNIISVLTVRIPGALLASVLFPETLYPMGLAPALGSLLSVLICIYLYKKHPEHWMH